MIWLGVPTQMNDNSEFSISVRSFVRSAEHPALDRVGDQFAYFRFDDGRFAGVDKVYLRRYRIHAYNLMTILRKAPGTYSPDIT